MWMSKKCSFQEIGLEGEYTIPQIPLIDSTLLPVYNEKQKSLLTRQGQHRTQLTIQTQVDHGSYGNVFLAKRNDQHVLLKQPRMAEMNLLQEAVLQYLAYKTVESEGMPWAIPKVYDVFWKGKEVWFSMERIHGIGVPEWFQNTRTPDTDILLLLAQVSLILITLEHYLNLDHRDLKSNNLLLIAKPCVFQVKHNNTTWILRSPFTVVVLDFGFACLGSEVLRGKPLVNLGDGILPPIDPCPKEGRDIFHLLTSLLGVPIIQQSISKALQDKIDRWLSIDKKSYGPMARRWSTENWSYLVSSQPQFSIPNCCPLRILEDLLSELKGQLIRT